MIRRQLSLCLLVGVCSLVATAPPAGAQDRDVVFVHGFGSDGGRWVETASRLEQDLAIAKHTPTIAWQNKFSDQTLELAGKVEQTVTPIMVGHSIGGLISRNYSRNHPVDGILTIGTPHAGAPLASNAFWLAITHIEVLGLINDIWTEVGLVGGDFWWIADAIAGGLTLMFDYSHKYMIPILARWGAQTALPVTVDARPGSQIMNDLNSPANLAREASQIPTRVGIVVTTDNFFEAGAYRLVDPDNADLVNEIMEATAWGLYVMATRVEIDGTSSNLSFVLMEAGWWLMDGLDTRYCELVSSTLPHRYCDYNDTFIPWWSQVYPGTTPIMKTGPAHIHEIDQVDWFDQILTTQFHVPRRSDPPPPPPPPPPPASCTFAVAPGSIDAPENGGTAVIQVSASRADCSWNAGSNTSWITVQQPSGQGSGTVTIVVSENNGANARSGSVTVAGTTVVVNQPPEACGFTLSPASATVGHLQSTQPVSVDASFSNCAWTAASNTSWLTISSGQMGTGDGNVQYSVAANTGNADRSGTLTIGGRTFQVTQQRTPVVVTVEFTSSASTAGESTGKRSFGVRLTTSDLSALTAPVSVPYSVNPVTATAGVDYLSQGAQGSILFPGASPSGAIVPIEVVVLNDGESESSETFSVALGTPSSTLNVVVGFNPTHSVTITEDDLPLAGGAAVGDFNGDRKSDIAVFNPKTAMWSIHGQTPVAFGALGDIPVPADYNGDRTVDLAVYRPSNRTWYVQNQATTQFGDPGDVPVPADYDGDGVADIAVYRPSNRTWYVRNQLAVQFGDPGDVPVPGDYDGDHETDIAVYRPSNGTWYIRNQQPVQFGGLGEVPVAADYDGDGDTDIAVYRPSPGEWRIRNVGTFVFGDPGDRPIPRDYDGDGRTDIAVYRPSTGYWYRYRFYPSGVQHGQIGEVPAPRSPLGPRAVAGDYDGDGNADVAVYRPSTSEWFVQGLFTQQYGLSGDLVIPGDYDGDGVVDLAVFRPSEGRFYVRNQFATTHGLGTDVPVPGDYDGNGTLDLAVYRPSTGVWYVKGYTGVLIGQANDVPVPGDYNGDGVTDVGVYRPSTGQWIVHNQATVQFGDPGDVPIPADYNGDGVTDVAVYRPSTGYWYVRNQLSVQYGDPGDIAVPADFDGDGRADVAVYRPSTGMWFVRNQFTNHYGDPNDIPVVRVGRNP